jgi:hypothetical protein
MRISSLADLQVAKRSNLWLRRPEIDGVVLDSAGDPEATMHLEHRIRDLFNDCGCQWASATFFFSFLSITTIGLATSKFEWPGLAITLLISLCAGIVAKLIALWVTHTLLKQELNLLAANFSSAKPDNRISDDESFVAY